MPLALITDAGDGDLLQRLIRAAAVTTNQMIWGQKELPSPQATLAPFTDAPSVSLEGVSAEQFLPCKLPS